MDLNDNGTLDKEELKEALYGHHPLVEYDDE